MLIAAITSCTNTSNPGVLLAAGLLAKKAVEAGLTVKPHIKTSLAPGSRIVTEYLTKAGLLPYLEKLGFNVAGYGCTTCIGNAGDLTPEINEAITKNDLVVRRRAVGQPQFRGAHPSQPQGQLPGLAAAGGGLRHRRQRERRPDDRAGGQGQGRQATSTWATSGRRSEEIDALMQYAMDAKAFRENYGR